MFSLTLSLTLTPSLTHFTFYYYYYYYYCYYYLREWLGPVEKEEREIVAPPPLEEKWAMAFDENGQKYYTNIGTGESQWEMPDAFKSKETLEAEKKAKIKEEKQAEINKKRCVYAYACICRCVYVSCPLRLN